MKTRPLLLMLGLLCLTHACAQKPKTSPKPVVKSQAQTATQQSAPQRHVFCVFGDSRPDGDQRRLQMTSRIAGAMAAERPEVVLGTGDYVDGARTWDAARKQWSDFFVALRPLQKYGPVSFGAAVGNHDLSGGMGNLWTQLLGSRYYSFDIGKAHFIILDTEQPGQVGRIDGQQWDWLCRDLTAAQACPLIFVALHEPLFPVSVHRGSSLDKYPKYRDRLHMLFARAKVNAVFAGHEHLYNHQKLDGVNYFITAGGGAPLYAEAARGGFYHYLKVIFTDDSYSVEVKKL